VPSAEINWVTKLFKQAVWLPFFPTIWEKTALETAADFVKRRTRTADSRCGWATSSCFH